MQSQVEYQHLRHRFIQQQNLSHDFNFSAYLEKCYERTCVQLVEIHWSVWAIVLSVVFINWVKYKIVVTMESASNSPVSNLHELIYWLIVGWGLLFISFIVWLKLRSIYNKMVADVDEPLEAPSLRLIKVKDVQKERLFWFNSPNLLFHFIQTILLFQAYYLAALAVYFGQLDWPVYWKISIITPPILTIAFYAPAVLPAYSLVANLERYTKPELIRKISVLPDKESQQIEKEETIFKF